MKILHLAHGPMQGIPEEYLRMERRFGDRSDLVFYESPLNTKDYPVIPQPLLDYAPIRWYRRRRLEGRFREAHRRLHQPTEADRSTLKEPPRQIAKGPIEALWHPLKDAWIRRRIPSIIDRFGLDGYDVVHFDGARDLTRSADLARELRRRGAHIVSVYYGTELRVEGVTPSLDALSDLHLSSEQDHLTLHPAMRFLYMPFDVTPFTTVPASAARSGSRKPLRMVHAPSDRYNKGTDYILPVIERLKQNYEFEFELIEGVDQETCRRLKAGCDLCIDQIGNRGGTGYGVSSLEMFALGIPCVTDFTNELVSFMPDHPFYLARPDTLERVLAGILEKPKELPERGMASRRWVEKHHGHEAVHARKRTLYREAGIL